MNKNHIEREATNKPMHPSSGESVEGVITSILIAASIVYTHTKYINYVKQQ